MSGEGGRGENGWSQTRAPDPALQSPECQQLNKEVPGRDWGPGKDWGGLSYVTKAQKRWAGGQREQNTRSCMAREPRRV